MAIVESIYGYLHSVKAEEGTTLDDAVRYFLNVEEESRTLPRATFSPFSSTLIIFIESKKA